MTAAAVLVTAVLVTTVLVTAVLTAVTLTPAATVHELTATSVIGSITNNKKETSTTKKQTKSTAETKYQQ